MSEIYLPVVGFEGFYEVSNTGIVRSIPWKTAWYNLKFNRAYKHLNAKSMKVEQKTAPKE